ncbi:MAG TPA: glycosyltransferase family 2 protein [Lachnospiraceae bacterium]|nr:glycosyltransferase family 2 protein [Lachnospiraceae bacterium]
MEEKVSIIVPVYNAVQYIEDTVATVLKQTYTNWELILVDDGSHDGSSQLMTGLLAEYKDERIFFYSRENSGAAKTRNFGLSKATGRYITYLDADDLWESHKLEKQLSFMKKEKAAFSFTSYEFADENGQGTGKIVKVPHILTYKQALQNTTIFTSTVMFDTDKIEKSILNMPIIKSEDTALWFKVLRRGYLAYGLDENLVRYRRVGGSLSANKMEALRRIWNLYRKSEHLSVAFSAYNFFFWALRAVKRRI